MTFDFADFWDTLQEYEAALPSDETPVGPHPFETAFRQIHDAKGLKFNNEDRALIFFRRLCEEGAHAIDRKDETRVQFLTETGDKILKTMAPSDTTFLFGCKSTNHPLEASIDAFEARLENAPAEVKAKARQNAFAGARSARDLVGAAVSSTDLNQTLAK